MPFERPINIDFGPCPHCRYKLKASISVVAESCRPQPGAIAVCICCRQVSVITAAGGNVLRLRRLTETEEQQIGHQNSLRIALAQVAADDWMKEQYGMTAADVKRFTSWFDAIRLANSGGQADR